MKTARKITVQVPEGLLDKAQRATGSGITETIRAGLQLLAASPTYARLRQFRGKVRSTHTLAELKADW
jgi:Arc/MetJ-type ribon-helix-helix transcriptional regulator